MITHQVAIIIPIYKEIPDNNELISLRQCCQVLGNYPIRIVCPLDLTTSVYENICINIKDLSIEKFDNKYFKSIQGYNSLLLSFDFYNRFIKYKYILIYQLDAYVFRDELKYWCSQGYDYIGAPWYFKGANKWAHLKEIRDSLPFWSKYRFVFRLFLFRDRMVGNGGFSLRNVQSHLNIISKFEKKIKEWRLYEDLFWAMFVKSHDFGFSIPGIRRALNFSIESQPDFAMKKNNFKLPFGCHAWPKYEFWNEYIPYCHDEIDKINSNLL